MLNLKRLGAIAAVAVLTACSNSPSTSTPPADGTARQAQDATPPPTTVPAAGRSEPVLRKLGEPFMLGQVRLTVLSVQDPFPPTAQTQPAPGNRLLSVKYEAINASAEPQTLSDLPSVEVRDSTGAGYESAHGRLSVAGGSRNGAEVGPGKRMESSVLFEVPSSATGLRVAFRSHDRPQDEAAVSLD